MIDFFFTIYQNKKESCCLKRTGQRKHSKLWNDCRWKLTIPNLIISSTYKKPIQRKDLCEKNTHAHYISFATLVSFLACLGVGFFSYLEAILSVDFCNNKKKIWGQTDLFPAGIHRKYAYTIAEISQSPHKLQNWPRWHMKNNVHMYLFHTGLQLVLGYLWVL